MEDQTRKMIEWETQEPENKGGKCDGEEKEIRLAGWAEEMEIEAGGSYSVAPKCLYVRTPTGVTMSDTEELSCLRTLAPDTIRFDK